jgi:hypothetical protein
MMRDGSNTSKACYNKAERKYPKKNNNILRTDRERNKYDDGADMLPE